MRLPTHWRKIILLGIAGVGLLALGLWLAQSGSVTVTPKGAEKAATKAETPKAPVVKPIDRARPLAVMIDNHPDALPQSGVDQASVVWEATVEGGLTRLMAVFRSGDVPEIGPVRSARPYFLDWAAGLDAVYAHVGGSDEAIFNLATKQQGLDDANEFKNGASFWRDNSRSAPHNAYTSTTKLRALIGQKGWRAETDRPDLTERGLAKPDGDAAATLKIQHSGGGNITTWTWDAASGTYLRSVSGRAVTSRDGARIGVANIVVVELKKKPIADPYKKGLIGIETVGAGPAAVYRSGVKLAAKWVKSSATTSLRIVDAAGKDIPLSDGLTWYEVVLTNAGGTSKVLP